MKKKLALGGWIAEKGNDFRLQNLVKNTTYGWFHLSGVGGDADYWFQFEGSWLG